MKQVKQDQWDACRSSTPSETDCQDAERTAMPQAYINGREVNDILFRAAQCIKSSQGVIEEAKSAIEQARRSRET